MVLIQKPTASVKPEAKIIQKRDASAKHIQVDQSKKKVSTSSEEPRVSRKSETMFSSRSNKPGNQFEEPICN